MDYYPTDARDKHISGRVELRCKTNPKGVLTDCTVRSEEPAGGKFGAATLKIAHKFRLKAAYAAALPSDTVIPLKMRWVSPG
ncbi:MAG: TonB family protein [Proteobacteria bacterium]|nr:TonB family protein [Pseudomonadota bacterium]